MYKAPSVRVPSASRLREITQSLKLDIEATELQEYHESISETLRGTYQRLYELEDPRTTVKYPRTPGYRPSVEDNPYNAWAWHCDIQGASSGKLYGKTVAIKDNACVAGVPLMNGSRLMEGYVPDVDATVVSRILDAGGRIIGKSVCENLCFDSASFTSATGPVVNPYNKNRMALGSSSGSAALVAGGHVDMALGGDQGGSIRMPAAACGIVGLKPTFGLVPYTGIISLELTLDHVGPMARTVYDTALLLEVLAGLDGDLDPRQPRALPIPECYTSQLTGDISHLKIGILKEGFGHPSSEADVDALFREAVKHLGCQKQATVGDVSVKMHLDGKVLLSAISVEGGTNTMLSGFGTSAKMHYDTFLQEAFARGLKTHSNDLPATVKKSLLLGTYLSAEHNGIFYSKAHNLGRKLCEEYDKVLQDCDVLVMPTIPKKAGTFPPPNASLGEYLEKASGNNINTGSFNITGHPALSINAGFSEGLPVGMMIVGRKFEDATVLNVGYAFERIMDSAG
ncbi:amidase-like isoform X1 [Montipora capricornis]|uniref:amidase-like isoform X1 n=1 Tax=Montipora capricornis TaxID=246305 RepID=UPI0035F1F82A